MLLIRHSVMNDAITIMQVIPVLGVLRMEGRENAPETGIADGARWQAAELAEIVRGIHTQIGLRDRSGRLFENIANRCVDSQPLLGLQSLPENARDDRAFLVGLRLLFDQRRHGDDLLQGVL